MLSCYKNKFISETPYNSIRPVGSQCPKLYGLPKIHKNDCPLRPILSMIGSPQIDLAKFLVKTLAPVLDKFLNYSLKDSFQFIEKNNLIPRSKVKSSYCSLIFQ